MIIVYPLTSRLFYETLPAMKWHPNTLLIIVTPICMALGRTVLDLRDVSDVRTWIICIFGMAALGGAIGFVIALAASAWTTIARHKRSRLTRS